MLTFTSSVANYLRLRPHVTAHADAVKESLLNEPQHSEAFGLIASRRYLEAYDIIL